MDTVNQVELVNELSNGLNLSLAKDNTREGLVLELSAYINQLIREDFQRLIRLLYRVDVNEEKLKAMLKEQAGEEAGKIIATLVIERQVQKMLFRARSGQKPDNDSSEERW